MFTISQRACHLPVIKIFRDVGPEILFSTSSRVRVGGSGRFRKMKPVTNSFLSRSPVKKSKEAGSNPSFDRDYLDKTVDKLLQGERRNRYRFLHKISPAALEPDKASVRENIIEDWNHIHETVISLGVPEWADVIGGQMFAGGHLRSTTTSCLTLRLADNLVMMRDEELRHLVHAIKVWPGDAGESETLSTLVRSLDHECAIRCDSWSVGDNIDLALILARFAFRPEISQFASKVIQMTSAEIDKPSSLDLLLSYLLLISYWSDIASLLRLDISSLRVVEDKLVVEFWDKMDQTEVAMVYTALNLLWQRAVTQSAVEENITTSPLRLKEKIQNTYGFRL